MKTRKQWAAVVIGSLVLVLALAGAKAGQIVTMVRAGESFVPPPESVTSAKVEAARKSGLQITADMYTYPAGATGLDAAMPPWVLDGGYPAAFKRLRDPETRKKIADAIRKFAAQS